VLVMREGRLVATLARDQATEEAIVAAGTGQVDRPSDHVGATA
jgi:ABC-type sugar transport system ATPase subunit